MACGCLAGCFGGWGAPPGPRAAEAPGRAVSLARRGGGGPGPGGAGPSAGGGSFEAALARRAATPGSPPASSELTRRSPRSRRSRRSSSCPWSLVASHYPG